MKKFLLIGIVLAVAVAFTSVNAQTFTMTGSGDTVTNTGTKACSLKVVHSYRQISIQLVSTKISGTFAGTVTLQGSVDGTNYVTVDSAAIVNDGLCTYVVANSSGAQGKVWIINYAPYLWYKLSHTGTGTMSGTLKGYLLPRD